MQEIVELRDFFNHLVDRECSDEPMLDDFRTMTARLGTVLQTDSYVFWL